MKKSQRSERLPNHLHQLRRIRGLSQKATAALLGKADARWVSHYENGTKLPTLKTALALQVILGAQLSEAYLPLLKQIEREVIERTRLLPPKLGQEIRCRLERKDPHVDT